MTREEKKKAIIELKDILAEATEYDNSVCYVTSEDADSLKAAIKALEFSEWVAEEIFSDDWEHNKDSFAEVTCRKLAKIGIVRAKGNEWELVEPQESEVKE